MATTMELDNINNHNTTNSSPIPITSLPFTKSVPIIVQQTGPIDDKFYPIYNTNKSSTISSNTSTSNTNNNHINTIDIDFLNNDDDLFQDISNTNKSNHSPLIIHKTRNEASNRYNLTSDDPIPYFMHHDLGEDDENELWIKGETVSTEQKANNTIIYNIINELQSNDTILIKTKPIHIPQSPIAPRMRSSCYYNRHNSLNNIDGEAIVTRVHRDNKWLTVKIHTTETKEHTTKYIYDIHKYEIIRIKSTNISKLYKVISNSEKNLMTQYLKKLLPYMAWIIVMDIASYLEYNYQRDIYFDCKIFENMVKNKYLKYENKEKKCNACTMSNPMGNKQCSLCKSEFKVNINEHWLGYDQCYENNILTLAVKDHPIFPKDKQRHNLYAKKPFLAVIPKEERNNLEIVQKRLGIGLKSETKLYKYQMHTVLWCYYIERLVENKQKIYIGSNDLRFTNNKNISCNVYCINDKEFIPANEKKILPPRYLRFRGGIIADDVGLGKSLTMLSLMLTNPFNNNIMSNSWDINQKLSIGSNDMSIKCAATLLIAPSHLINQWKNEIIKHFKLNIFKIIIITTANEHNKISYNDILNAQIVLVSSVFLCGLHYQRRINDNKGLTSMNNHWSYLDPSLPIKPIGNIRRNTRSRKQKYQDLQQTQIYFELLHWRRVIIDEGHEYLSDEKIRNVIFNIESDFCWYVTGTPFPDDNSIGYAADFLDIQFDSEYYNQVHWNDQLNNPLGYVLHCIIYNHLFSRHTKESILDDNYLPDIIEDVEYVNFHPIERLFYEIVKSRRNTNKENKKLERRICSGVLNEFEIYIYSTGEGYLNDLLNMNKRHYPISILQNKNNLIYEKDNLKQLKQYEIELNAKKKEYENVGKIFTLQDAFPLQREREKYQRIKQKLKTCKRKINEYEFEIIRNKKENKMIENDNIFDEINKYEMKFNDKNDGKYLLNIVQKYGTKQAAILEYVKTLYDNKHNRIIIFSLFGQTLNAIRNRLRQIKVDCVLCSGNVHMRKKAMNSFQNDDYNGANRIILLSVENAASGANLNKATHVILVDPVPGSSSESFAAERQAVGRAVRQGMNKCKTKVIRFVVRNTIEEETYERNKEIRQREMCMDKDMENVDMGEKLKQKLTVQRRDSEIEFFLKINDVSDERKRKLNDDDDDDDEKIENEEINDDEPKKKRRRLNGC